MNNNQNRFFSGISIKTIILISFIVSVAVTVGGIGYLIYNRWSSSNNTVIKRIADDLNIQIIHQIDQYLNEPEHIIEVNSGLVEKGVVDLSDEAQRDKFFLNILNTHKGNVNSVSFGSELGEYYGARKNENDKIEIIRNNEETGGNSWYFSVDEEGVIGDLVKDAGRFDPRTREWYKTAKNANEFTFSPIYKHFVVDDLTVSAAAPVKNENGVIEGVFGVHLLLSGLNEALEEIAVPAGSYALIVEKDTGNMVANSLGEDNYAIGLDSSFGRLHLSYTENRVAWKTYQEYLKGNSDLVSGYRGKEKLFSKYEEFSRPGIDWLVITAVPESLLGNTLMEAVDDSIKIGLLSLIASIFVFIVISKKLFSPIDEILEANKRFSEGDLKRRIKASRNDEIGRIAESYNEMAERIYTLVNNLEEEVTDRTDGIRKVNSELRESKDSLQLILDSAAEGIYGIDKDGNCTFINKSALSLLGYSSPEELLGKNMHGMIHHSRRDGMPMWPETCKILLGMKQGKGVRVDDEVFWRRDNTSFDVEYFSYPQIENGEIIGGVVTFNDITEKLKLQRQIYNDKEQYRTTLLSVGDGVISTDNKGRVEVMNPVAEMLTGWTQEEAKGKRFDKVFHIINEHTGELSGNPVERVLESMEIIELANHTVLISKDGRRVPIEDSAAPIRSEDGTITGVVIVFRDYTEKREKLKEIEYLNFHDHLTGLYNRRYMEDSIRRLDSSRNLPFTILAIDVNGLKLTNDAFGHRMGDNLLMNVASMLKRVCREDDIIGRMGGDEFMVLLPRTDQSMAESIKIRIEEASREVKLDSVIVSLAVGYATKTKKEEDISAIMTLADNNMYKDKLKYGRLMRSQTIEIVLKNINLKYDKEQIHTERVSQYCAAIAREMDFPDAEIEKIKTSAILHDIGKITVPPEILNKPGRLTPEEYEMIKKHPETGYQILKSVDEYASLANYVLYHHERIDGTGYPEGLKGEDIPLVSRIIAVADAYEAMTSKRSYQAPRTREEAAKELLRCSGTQFDSEIVGIFVRRVLGLDF
ncbi:HD domain-containing phosphohydrolase [Gudongella oleilytica]|uniref:HD domain-containing phosphohydrolase n=1 Tax=Gudongella oleilytica TaxID=1582259 RepID=UPI002A36F35A|nr:HD domain-containing phosphohydrolase [Gudongella oleilytica]MDY0256825.1 diguanylate cyclase [Gudongella oleilytica]